MLRHGMGSLLLTMTLTACSAQVDDTALEESELGACSPLVATSVSASGNDGNVPANAVDGKLSTRWSSSGVGQFITLDLGAAKTVCGLELAWYQGASRVNSYVISLSTDGATFRPVLTQKSSGKTASFEAAEFEDMAARYVRITVNGNTANTWASISDIRVLGGSVAAIGESLFGTTSPPPAERFSTDTGAVTLGVIFQSKVAGQIHAVRFYRAKANARGYAVSLWSKDGTLLGSGKGGEGSLPGWQVVPLANPVSILAHTPYVASYSSSNGAYAFTQNGFANGLSQGNLSAPTQAGVYRYGASAFPSQVYQASNYWVDVSFTPASGTPVPPMPVPPTPDPSDTTAPAVSIASPVSGATLSGAVTVSGSASDNVGLAKVELQVDNGAFQLATGTTSWTYSLAASGLSSGSHTLTARATDASANTMTASITFAITSSSPPPSGAFPNASNTGLPAGTVLTKKMGSMTLNTPGQVLEDVEVNGCITLGANAHNVTIRRVLVRSSSCFWLILNDNGATNLQVIDSELDGLGVVSGDAAVAGGNYTLTRVNIHGTIDGAKMGSNVIVQDSYIHDLAMGNDSHNDGLQALDAKNLTIRHNTIIVKDGATSAIIFSQNSSSGWELRDVLIENNLLGGGAFTVYGGYQAGKDNPNNASNVRILNNQFTTAIFPKGGAFGAMTSVDAPVVTRSGNTWADGPNAGKPVN